MKLYVAVIAALALSTLTLAHEDKYERMLKKWVKVKAMEGCFGEENLQMWIVKMKKAKAICCKKPAPELHLPMFQKPVRVTNALLGVSSSGLTAKQEAFVDEKMRNRFIAKLMAKEMDDMALDEATPYFINKYAMNMRFTREADEEDSEGDMMDDDEMNMSIEDMSIEDMMYNEIVKLEDSFEAEIGNVTCVMQEMGIINEENELDIPAMDKCLDEGKYTKEESADGVDRTWLQAKLKSVHAMCKEVSDAVPQSVLDNCSLPDWMTKLKSFHKCMKFHKIDTCMQSDMRHKLTSKGVNIENLSQKAGLSTDHIITMLSFIAFK